MRPVMFALLFAVGCSAGDSVGPVPQFLREAPETITLNGAVLTVEAELWRDFMPSPQPDTRLGGVAKLRSSDGAVPGDVTVDEAWLILGAEAWRASVERDSYDPRMYRFRHGPEWPVGAKISVVVRLRGGPVDRQYLITRGVPIQDVY